MEEELRIKTVTVAGITGAVGPAIISSLAATGFIVQALSRSNSDEYTVQAPVIKTNYTDFNRICEILTGQDAIVSCLGDTPAAVEAQRVLIEAAIKVGVRRFIPSEFGSDTTNEKVKSFPFFKAKLEHQTLLREAALTHAHFSYSLLITGPFLDWGLSVVPFIINAGNRTAETIDGGSNRFSITRTSTVGKGIATLLRLPQTQTANRAFFMHEAVVTKNQLIARASRLHPSPRIRRFSSGSRARRSSSCVHGPRPSFTLTDSSSEALETSAWAAFEDPDADPLEWILPFVNLSLWSKDELCWFEKTDNELLGVEELEGEELERVLDEELKEAMRLLGADEGEEEGKAEKAFESGKRRLVVEGVR